MAKRKTDSDCTNQTEHKQTRPSVRKTKEEKALALTSDGIFRAFEKAVPSGATTVHVLEAAATLIASSLEQMNATRQDLHAVIMHLEDYVLKRVKLNDRTRTTA